MFELRIQAPEQQVEDLCDALEALGALSVSVEDADAHTEFEKALFGEPGMPVTRDAWQRSLLVALFQQQADAEQAQELLVVQDFFQGCSVLQLLPVPEQDWVRLTQSQFAPVEITPEFWIVPTWHDAPAQAKTVIRLDPGLAFGTGTHPTTRMCLRWLAGHKPIQQTVLDYGCGSGILAIGAGLLGADSITAVDIDEAAVAATIDNAAVNRVNLTAGLPELAQGQYNLVLANILATPLKVLAPLLCSHVAKGGYLVLAGILSRQAEELTTAYSQYCDLQVHAEEEGWVCMTARF